MQEVDEAQPSQGNELIFIYPFAIRLYICHLHNSSIAQSGQDTGPSASWYVNIVFLMSN
jgi:hypothetical protein